MDRHYRTIVIGAGVSGLSTALVLSKAHLGEVLVLEREAEIGGQCRTLARGNARFDTGSHRIHDQPSARAFELIKSLCGDKLLRNERGGKLRIHGGYIDYPITSFKMFLGLGLVESARCAISLVWGTMAASAEATSTYASYLERRAGKRGYRIFYEPYARKVWACDPNEISMTAVKKRISMTNPTQILVDMLRHLRGKSPRNYYYYVDGGIGGISEALAERVVGQGGIIETGVEEIRIQEAGGPDPLSFRAQRGISLDTEIPRVARDDNTLQAKGGKPGYRIEYTGKVGPEVCTCDTLVSTIPIRELMAKLGVEQRLTRDSRQLSWRGLRFVALFIQGEPLLDGETFYYPELRFVFGRVSVPKRYSSHMLRDESGTTTVLCEVPCGPGDALWEKPDAALIGDCKAGLVAAGFVRPDQWSTGDRDFAFRLSGTYPIYYVGWQEAFAEALAILGNEFPFVYSSGKQGLYLHCNLDHAMEIGLELGEHILAGGDAASWYQRAAGFHEMRIRD